MKIRRKVLGQTLSIPFTHHRKQRSIGVIIKELSDFIHSHSQSDASNPFSPVGDSSSSLFLSSDPFSLVGKTIQHRFCLESGEHKWFCGAVISYNPVAKTHEIAYEDEEEHQHYI